MKKIINLICLSLLTSVCYAETISYSEQVPVISSEEVYKNTRVKYPERRYIQENNVPCNEVQSDNNSLGLDTVIGAGLGVVLGNQIGRGNGKIAAKVAGGVGGAVIANQTRDYRNGNSSDCSNQRNNEREVVDYSYRDERVLDGYNNYFMLNGQELVKFSNSRLNYITINHRISY